MKLYTGFFTGVRFALLTALAIQGTLYSGITLAQASQNKTARVIEEVIVTATKRSKSERDVPLSIDAFNTEALEALGGNSSQDVALFSAGVSINEYFMPGQATVQIRGTVTDTVGTQGSTPAGTFFGELPLAAPNTGGGNPNIDAFDLAAVEVLKGPQGTLFGGSALAGALRSIPAQANTQDLEAKTFYSYQSLASSNDSGNEYGVMLNVPVTNKFALRGILVERNTPGFIDNDLVGEKDVDSFQSKTSRISAKFEATEKLTLSLFIHEMEGDVNGLKYSDGPSSRRRNNETGAEFANYDHTFSELKLNYAFAAFDLSISAGKVDKYEFMIGQVDRGLGGQTEFIESATFTEYASQAEVIDVRLVSSSATESRFWFLDDWDWLIGYYTVETDQQTDLYFPSEITLGIPVLGFPVPDLSVPVEIAFGDLDVLAEETAIYIDTTKYIGDKWELSIGARIFDQSYSGTGRSRSGGELAPENRTAPNSAEDGINPKFALTWHAFDNIDLLLIASKGFRFGGINVPIEPLPTPPIPETYESDELWNYELTARTEWFERQLIVDVTAFYIDWDRIQIQQRTNSGITPFIENAVAATSQGAEISVTALLPWQFTATLSGAYIDSKFSDDFESSTGFVPKNDRLPGTPYWGGSFILGHNIEIGSAVVGSNLTVTYQGEAFDNATHNNIIDDYTLFGFNTSVKFDEVPGRPKLSLSVKNLFDERKYNGVYELNGLTGSLFDFFPTSPRTITAGIELSY